MAPDTPEVAWAEVRALKERFARLEGALDEVHDIAVDVRVQAEQARHTREALSELMSEVKAIRARPLGAIDVLRGALISSTVATIVAMVVEVVAR